MKLEVPCKLCQSLLRVNAEHAGKMMRCPSCNGLTQIPAGSELNDEAVPDPTNSANEPSRPPASAGNQDRPSVADAEATLRSNSYVSLIVGIVGVVTSLVCGGCISPGLVIANLVGLYLGIRSKGGVKQAAIIMNLLALSLETFLTWWYYT